MSCPDLRTVAVLPKVKFQRTVPIPPMHFPRPGPVSSPSAHLKVAFPPDHVTLPDSGTLLHSSSPRMIYKVVRAWFRKSKGQDPFHHLWTSPWATAMPWEMPALYLKWFSWMPGECGNDWFIKKSKDARISFLKRYHSSICTMWNGT